MRSWNPACKCRIVEEVFALRQRFGTTIIFAATVLGLLIGSSPKSWADNAPNGAVPGYLSDVRGERNDPSVEFVIMPLPAPHVSTKLYNKIFTKKLKQDFINNYRKTFGYTEYEQIQSASNQYQNVESSVSDHFIPVDNYITEQRQFGQYMLNALVEYHVDNFFKHSKSLRKVYQVQKKLSHVEYKTKSGEKLQMRYQLASNTATISLTKPHEKFHKSLDFQVGGQANTVLQLGYDLTHRVNLQTDLQFEDEILTFIASRNMGNNLSTNITLQSIAKDQNPYTPKQNLILVGLSWND